MSDGDYDAAMATRREFSAAYEAVLAPLDALLCPAGGVTFPVNVDQYGNAETLDALFSAVQMHFTIPADFSGVPTLTLPCGHSAAGIPHTLQLVGSKLSEERLCRIGFAYESATEWHHRHPDL